MNDHLRSVNATKEKQDAHQNSENPIDSNNPLMVEFSDGEKGIVHYTLNLELIDSILIPTAEKFGVQKKPFLSLMKGLEMNS